MNVSYSYAKRSIKPIRLPPRAAAYAELSSAGLKISPVDSNVPKEADALREDVYGLLPHVKITDLLLEIYRWTGLLGTRPFEGRRTSKDPTLLLTAGH